MTFIYFIPDWTVNLIESIDQLPESVASLKKILKDATTKTHKQGITATYGPGPRDRNGTFVAALPTPGSGGAEFTPFEYDKTCRADADMGDNCLVGDQQTWREVQNQDGTTCYWLGWRQDSKPTPADLVRSKTIDGHPVTLADGNDWLIPVVGPYSSRLPRSFSVSAKGELDANVRKDFRKLFEDSDSIRQRFYHDGKITRAEMWLYVASLLTVNYRVGPHEIADDCLGILNTENYIEPFKVSIGMRDIEIDDEIKKNAESAPGDT